MAYHIATLGVEGNRENCSLVALQGPGLERIFHVDQADLELTNEVWKVQSNKVHMSVCVCGSRSK